jgi:3-deoxy-D-manno-octulosonic acid kinase
VRSFRAREAPPGYERIAMAGAEVVALSTLAQSVRDAMREGSLFAYAAHHPEARAMAGRGVAWAVPLPDGETHVVVRHSRHGGLLAPLTGDRFIAPTRAPRELDVAVRLARCGVPTPEVIAYALHRAGPLLRRADVATREVPGARDLGTMLTGELEESTRREALAAVAALVVKLSDVGARHPDLNVKNVLLARDENGALEGWVLDVDRVWFDEPGAEQVTVANLRRLFRSARKWRRDHGAAVDEGDLERLRMAVEAEVGPLDAAAVERTR